MIALSILLVAAFTGPDAVPALEAVGAGACGRGWAGGTSRGGDVAAGGVGGEACCATCGPMVVTVK